MPYIQCLGLGFSKKHVVQDLYVLDVFFFCRQKITQAERWCRYTESPLKGFSVALVGRSQQLNDCVHNTKEIKRSVFSLLKSYQTQFWDITCFEGEPFDGTYMPDQWYVMFVGCLVLLLLLSSPDLVVQNCRAFFCFKVFQLNQKPWNQATLRISDPSKTRPPCIIQVHLRFHWRVQWSLQTFSPPTKWWGIQTIEAYRSAEQKPKGIAQFWHDISGRSSITRSIIVRRTCVSFGLEFFANGTFWRWKFHVKIGSCP